MVDFACGVMIDGRIRRREPSLKFVSQLVLCDGISTSIFSDMGAREQQTFYLMGFCFQVEWWEEGLVKTRT
jgi:hypothetical protein